MGIFSRFADIVNANLNALLDKAEDPEKLIRLIIQEMEDTLVEVRTTSARTIAEKKELQRKIDWLKKQADDWQERAELALSKSREDLAKSALVEKNSALEASRELKEQMQAVENTLDKLSTEIVQLQDKLADAKARQNALMLRHKTASSRLKVKRSLSDTQADDALTRFERFERKLDNLEAEVDSYDLGSKKSLADEIEDLETGEKIDAELAKLKARMARSGKAGTAGTGKKPAGKASGSTKKSGAKPAKAAKNEE